MGKARAGNFFEDFRVGQEIRHATPRTIGEGDAALYLALTGSRFLQHCCDPFARANGLPRAPVEDLLAFHTVFGKTVPDVSLNAVANLGYADGALPRPGLPGRHARRRLGGDRPQGDLSGQTGIVWVRSRLQGRRRARPRLCALGDGAGSATPTRRRRGRVVPELPAAVDAGRLVVPAGLRAARIDPAATGSPHFFEDYAVGERIDHVDGMGVMESRAPARDPALPEHGAGPLQRPRRAPGPARRLHRLRRRRDLARPRAHRSTASATRSTSSAINAGTHVNPCRAGDTVYAWSEVLDTRRAAGP